MVHVSSGKDVLALSPNAPLCDTIENQQASLIEDLEQRVQQLTEEKACLTVQLEAKLSEHRRQCDAYISRYVNADYLLALFGSKLVAKRFRPDFGSNTVSRVTQGALGDPNGIVGNLQSCRYLLEPATNLVYQRMHEVTKEAYTRVRQSHDDLLAWKFVPDSSNGRQLMSHVRQLLTANQTLGLVSHADRIGRLEADVDMETTCIKEFVNTHQGIDTVLSEAYTDLEGLQSSLLILHQQLSQAEAVVEELQGILETKQPGRVSQLMAAVLSELGVSEISNPAADSSILEPDNTTVTGQPSEEDTGETVAILPSNVSDTEMTSQVKTSAYYSDTSQSNL